MLEVPLRFREGTPGFAETFAAVVVGQKKPGGIVAAFLVLCASHSWAQSQPVGPYGGQPRVIVNNAKILPATCTGEWEVLTKAGSNTWRGPKDWVRATYVAVQKSGVTQIAIKSSKRRLTPSRLATIRISGQLTNACRPGYFRLKPRMTLEITRNNRTVLVNRAGQTSRVFAVPPAAFSAKPITPNDLTYNANSSGEFHGGLTYGRCCMSGSFNLTVMAGRNTARINFARARSNTTTIKCTPGRHFVFPKVAGRLADPNRNGRYRLVIRMGKSPKSTTRVCKLDLQIPSKPEPRDQRLLAPSFKGFAGRWLVNANGYIFVVDIKRQGNRISGIFRGITKRDSSLSSISGSVGNGRIQFTRSKAATRNHPPQPYSGRLIATNTGRWMMGTFRHRGGTFKWCAVDERLVKRLDRAKWRDCTIGGRPAKQ